MNFIQRALANKAILRIVLLMIASALILNYPWLLSWLPQEAQVSLCKAATQILTWGTQVALLFVKQSNLSGLGTPDDPLKKIDASVSGGTKIL